jgi:hypothetical protein
VLGLDPQHAVTRHRALRRAAQRHLPGVPAAGDAGDHVLAPDLIPVEADPAHDRVLARPALAARVRAAALVQADRAPGQALLADPPPPLVLVGDHLGGAGVDRVVEAARLGAGEARADHVTRLVRVLVGHRPQRVAELVQRDQRSLRRAAGRRRLPAADPAVGERVEDRQRLDVLRRGRDPEHRRHVAGEDPIVRLVAVLARVDARRVVGGEVLAVQRRVPVRRAAGQRVDQPVLVPQPQGRVLRVDRPFALTGVPDGAVGVPDAPVGVAPHAVVDRGDLDRVHVDVVAVALERLGRPHHREVAVDVPEEEALLVLLVAVAQDDQVQPLGGRSGDLDRVHDRLRERPLCVGRRAGQQRGQQAGRRQRRESAPHRCAPCPSPDPSPRPCTFAQRGLDVIVQL